MPGSNSRALEKARALEADCIIMDLEDAVAPDSKADARRTVCQEIGRGGYGYREIIVRVNALASVWGPDDVAAVAKSGANAVLLPKVESVEQVRELQALLRHHGAPSGVEVWCMIETPLGVLNVAKICRGLKPFSDNRLTTLCMGFADLGKELHAPQVPGRHNFIASAQLCLLAARAYGLVILDGVHLTLHDLGDFEQECRQGVEWGMDGKTLIHPKQLKAANAAFAPARDEVERSKRMIAAHAEATARGEGVVLLDGAHRTMAPPWVAQ